MFTKFLRGRRSPTINARAQLEAMGAYFDLGDLLARPRYLNEQLIRGMTRSAFLGESTAVCRVLGRYDMLVDTADRGLSIHLMTGGYWEMWHTEAMMRVVKPGMKVADIGANLGYFTMLLGDLVGQDGTVHAFEPNPALAERLGTSIAINGFGGRTTLHRCALGAADGIATMDIPAHQPMNGRVVAGQARGGVQIEVKRLDGIPELQDVDFMKIDVEGAEEGLWSGMQGLLATGRPLTIILEYTPARYRDAGAFLDEILSSGFSLAIIDHRNGIVETTRAEVLARPPREDQLLVLRR